MFISKLHLPRRTVLRGLGAGLALPLLDAMVPAMTALAQTAAAPIRRFGVFYVPNGMAMPYWYPSGFAEGAITALPPVLRSLSDYKDRVLMCGGFAAEAARLIRTGDHVKSSGTFLTGVAFKDAGGTDVYNAVSMDQIVAKAMAAETPLASLELGMEHPGFLGSCDGGQSCAYTNTISWLTPTTPLPIENDPRALFERLFGTSGSTDHAARTARLKKDRSILDFVGREAASLERAIGVRDRLKLAEYLDSVRDIERRIQMTERQNTRELPVVNQPVGVPTDYGTHAKLMLDLLAIAFQTDLTRVSTFMMGREVSARPYPEIGISDSHHPLSHHQDEPAKIERLSKINEYHCEQFAHLVKKLAATPDGDGTLLDSSLMLYGTGISDSNTHFHDDLPIMLLGGRAGRITGGRYIRYPKQPLTNLLVTLLETLGLPLDKLGDSTGKVQGLTNA